MSLYNFIIPYRGRADSLKVLLEELPKRINKMPYITRYNILIVEQDYEKLFNLGKLLNVGFHFLKNGGLPGYIYNPWDIFFFHPVDKLPAEDANYKHEEIGLCWLVDETEHKGYPKATLMQNIYMEKINGYCNQFYFYGGDDEEQAHRYQASETNYLLRKTNFTRNESSDPNGLAAKLPIEIAHEIICDLKIHKNIYYSGLNTLRYSIVSFDKIQDNTYRLLVKL